MEDKKKYQSPELEVKAVAVECGFAITGSMMEKFILEDEITW